MLLNLSYFRALSTQQKKLYSHPDRCDTPEQKLRSSKHDDCSNTRKSRIWTKENVNFLRLFLSRPGWKEDSRAELSSPRGWRCCFKSQLLPCQSQAVIGSSAGFVTCSPGSPVMWPWTCLQQGEVGLHEAGELFRKPNTFPAPQQGKSPGEEQLQPAAPQHVTWPGVPLAAGFLCMIPSSSLCMPS